MFLLCMFTVLMFAIISCDVADELDLIGEWDGVGFSSNIIVKVVFKETVVSAWSYPVSDVLIGDEMPWYNGAGYAILSSNKMRLTHLSSKFTNDGEHITDFAFIGDTLVIDRFKPNFAIDAPPYPLNLTTIHLIRSNK
ncbi:MAG: hypothetical protein LBU83_06525 [Bacteroidales bacterium]|nr:hypothetical protein [Bacteroidales bacterium]